MSLAKRIAAFRKQAGLSHGGGGGRWRVHPAGIPAVVTALQLPHRRAGAGHRRRTRAQRVDHVLLVGNQAAGDERRI